MEALFQKKATPLEPVITDFPSQAKGVKFRKEILIEELLSLSNAKITKQIAELIGTEVEKEIHNRKIQFLSSELISEMVEAKLEELGLIRKRNSQILNPDNNQKLDSPSKPVSTELIPEVLEILAPGDKISPDQTFVKAHPKKAPLQFSEAALTLLRKKFLIKNEKGEIIETPEELLTRVARAVASADIKYSPNESLETLEAEFYNLMASREFFPSSHALLNAGRALGSLSSCFVLPIQDTMESIFEIMKQTAIVHKNGGSTGFNFTRLRPRNDSIQTGQGFSSGPVSFMNVYHAATEAVKQGGKQGGETRAILRVNHPDILDFLNFKETLSPTARFHLTVGFTEDFMKALAHDENYDLINPRSGEVFKKIKARKIFRQIVRHIWKHGEPEVVFLERLEASNPTPQAGPLEALDPCSGQPLLPYEACNLGSLNLATVTFDGKINWGNLKRIVHSAIHFLDNMIEVNHYPLQEVDEAVKNNRKIGLGVMGWADLLVKLGLSYASEEALTLAEQIMSFIQNEAQAASYELAKKRGVFPRHSESLYADKGIKRRHALLTALTSSETLGQLAGVSAGINPLNYLVSDQNPSLTIHSDLALALKTHNLFSEELLRKILALNSLQELSEVHPEIREVFMTGMDISPEWNLKMQSAFQRYTENAVSRTIYLSQKASEDDIGEALLLAYHLGCKTVSLTRLEEVVADSPIKEPKNKEVPDSLESLEIKTPQELPEVMQGITRRLKTACGEVYVTLNEGGTQRLSEIFTRLDKAGSCTATQVEALARVISLALRSGVDAHSIIQELKGLSCAEHKGNNESKPLSLADGLAQAMLHKIDL